MVLQPCGKILVPTRNMHKNIIEFFYRTGSPHRWKMVTSGWAQDSWNNALLPHPKFCLPFLGTSDDHPLRSPVWPLSVSSLEGSNSFRINCCYYKDGSWFQMQNTSTYISRETGSWFQMQNTSTYISRETSTLLGKSMPMKSRKKSQKKETTPIPKKCLEYEVSYREVVRGSTLTETTHPGQAP